MVYMFPYFLHRKATVILFHVTTIREILDCWWNNWQHCWMMRGRLAFPFVLRHSRVPVTALQSFRAFPLHLVHDQPRPIHTWFVRYERATHPTRQSISNRHYSWQQDSLNRVKRGHQSDVWSPDHNNLGRLWRFLLHAITRRRGT
jgi:hypothetical protein